MPNSLFRQSVADSVYSTSICRPHKRGKISEFHSCTITTKAERGKLASSC